MLLMFSCKADENNIKYYSPDLGILSLMYHRFDENKYPSTNIATAQGIGVSSRREFAGARARAAASGSGEAPFYFPPQ